MRKSFVVALLCAVALTAGVIGLLKGRSAAKESKPDVEMASAEEGSTPAQSITLQEPVRHSPQSVETPTTTSSQQPTSTEPVIETEGKAVPVSTPFSRAIDTLVSADASFQQKQTVWRQLQESGQLDHAIEALKQGTADNPKSAVYQAALGHAQLQKAGELSQNGGSVSDMGILGMQADKNFDTALQLDPSNWEAQFFKAAAMSYWPLELNKGDEVIQRLSRLIDQQETMRSQPEFAQTYVVLGDQYQKMGQTDYALATWQIGAQRFPGNPIFQQKIGEQ
jgi:tetratricopeptide (TPR) repeat protein